MLRPIMVSGGMPDGRYQVDPTATFEAGMIGGLIVVGGDILLTVSDGCNIQPLGIIDDTKTEAFSKPMVDEVVIIPATGVLDGMGNLVSAVDVMGTLEETNIVESSFSSNTDIILNAKNGVITVPAGSILNFDDGTTQGFEVIVSYRYKIADFPGEDTTVGSGQVTIWFTRGFFATDQYDTTVDYPLNSNLYVGEDGKLTTRERGVVVAMTIGPPSSLIGELEFLWL